MLLRIYLVIDMEHLIPYERLMKIAKSMHTFIFLHVCDEEKAYKECGLSDEENRILGSIYIDGKPTIVCIVESK